MIQYIFEYPFLTRIFNEILDDRSKINLISCSKIINQYKFKLRFNDRYICLPQYQDKWFFNCLTNISVGDNFKFPENVTRLHYWHIGPFPTFISDKIIYLEFGVYLNSAIAEFKDSKFVKSYIPNSVKHLTLGYYFNQEIIGLPNSIETLILYTNKCCEIVELPKSLTYLKIRSKFAERIRDFRSENTKIEFFKK